MKHKQLSEKYFQPTKYEANTKIAPVIEGTLSASRAERQFAPSYRILQKTHLQEIAPARGIDLLRAINFLNEQPTAKT